MIASLVKQDMIDNPENYAADPTTSRSSCLANPMRPNGGILSRGPEGLTIPILGVTFYGATPTNSCETGECNETVDVAAQYDGLGGDAPVSITNLLAVANAGLGYYYLHGDLQNATFDDALYQGSHGDTDYYILPARRLPDPDAVRVVRAVADPHAVRGTAEGRDRGRLRAGRQSGRRHQSGVAPVPGIRCKPS